MWFVFLLLLPAILADDLLDIPSNVAVRSVAAKGTFLCGKKPLEGARIRLYRTPQFTGDDIRQIIDEKVTYITGMWHVEGSTEKFPKNETVFEPWLSIHHTCQEDVKQIGSMGYRRWNFRIPDDYVTTGKKPTKVYDFGTLNIEMEVPGEIHDKSYKPNPNANLKPPPPTKFTPQTMDGK